MRQLKYDSLSPFPVLYRVLQAELQTLHFFNSIPLSPFSPSLNSGEDVLSFQNPQKSADELMFYKKRRNVGSKVLHYVSHIQKRLYLKISI